MCEDISENVSKPLLWFSQGCGWRWYALRDLIYCHGIVNMTHILIHVLYIASVEMGDVLAFWK
jgi:hypothetical protein